MLVLLPLAARRFFLGYFMNLLDDLKALQFIATWLNYSTDDCAKVARIAVGYHAPHLLSAFTDNAKAISDEKAINKVKSERESHSLAYLMKKHDIELDVFEFHDSLENAGIIELKTNNEGFEYYSITAAGLGFGKNVIVPSANSNDIKEQPSWYDDTFLDLRAIASNY